MEDQDIQIKQQDELPVQGSGSILAAERKRQNKTPEEIAIELNLSVTQIRTIELDQSDGLPEPTYVRGYIRSYANLLGLEPEHVLKNYLNSNWQQSSKLDDMPGGIGNSEIFSTDKSSVIGRFVVLLIVVAMVVGILYSGVLGRFSSDDNKVVAVPASLPDSVEDEQALELSLDEVIAETDDAINTPPAVEPETPQLGELEISFAQTSWVDIRDDDDNRLAYKNYLAGETLLVSSAGSMRVFIGNVQGVTVRYNGENFDIEQYREGVYAKFSVNEN